METISQNGNTYVITDPVNKKVKKLNSFDNLEELLNGDTVMQDTLLGTIHSFLREKEPETTRKKDKNGNWIICRGFKIQFDEAIGFMISDMFDYGRHCEEFDNPCPTPREVWDFISTSNNARTVKEKTVYVPVTEKKVSTKAEKHYTEKIEEELTIEEYEFFRKDLLDALNGLTVPKMADMVFKFIPNRKFNHRVNKLCNAYWEGGLRGAKFKESLMELINTHNFEETKKPAKKFVGLNWYLINSLEIIKDDVSFVTKTEGRFHFSKSEFLARYLIHTDPKCMPQIWRFVNGFITYDQLVESPILKNDTDAKYIDFDISCLRKSNPDLFKACNRILLNWEEPNPLNICYKNDLTVDLKVGDYIEVFWKDMHTSFTGKVIDFTGGVRLRYDDGDVVPLYKWQEFDVISKRA